MKKTQLLFFCLLCYQFAFAQDNRTFDGSSNNLAHPEWNAVDTRFMRITPYNYSDSIAAPNGADRPNPRIISNAIFAQDNFIGNPAGLSDFGWGFGQFLDHDLTFNLDTAGHGTMMIPIPECDPHFDPHCTGQMVIPMNKAAFDPTSGTDANNPMEQANFITGWVDASGIYGSRKDRADWLRTFEGGKLKTSANNLLPYNTLDGTLEGEIDPNTPFMIVEGHPKPEKFFVAGDIRANEQPSLTSFHTLFVREHNRLCDSLQTTHPSWNDEALYQQARKMVGALMQIITYEEFLPALGIPIDDYKGYNAEAETGILGIFSGAAFRLGHTLVNEQLIRLDGQGDTLSFGSIHIKDAFFNPNIVREENGIAPIFRGMATQRQQTFDHKVVNTLRNFLFGPPGAGGLDLVALNIQRARERGFPDYNTIRESFGLEKRTAFSQITANRTLAHDLATVYGSIDKVDPWVGMVCEDIDTSQGFNTGETIRTILKKQFEMLRDGDRYWYENDLAFSEEDIAWLKNQRLAKIIKRNTGIENMQDNVFFALPHDELQPVSVEITPFTNIRRIDIEAFPNPVADNFTLTIKSVRPEKATLRITNKVGQIIKEEALTIARGENKFAYQLDENYTSGLYIISLQTEDQVGQLKIVKQ